MNVRTTLSSPARSPRHAFRRPPGAGRRPALYLAVAAAGAMLVGVVGSEEPAAHADPQLESISVAQELGITAADRAAPASSAEQIAPLAQLAASRSDREAERTAAAQAQTAADKAELAARAAAAQAAKVAVQKAAAAAAAKKAAAARPSGSFQDYALSKIGSGQFSCLESLWGKESGWNPDAQNPSSSAYGIPQLLDSTWGGTGIAKTSDGYRQIDAGLVYIERAYGSPCAAWAHSQSTGWY